MRLHVRKMSESLRFQTCGVIPCYAEKAGFLRAPTEMLGHVPFEPSCDGGSMNRRLISLGLQLYPQVRWLDPAGTHPCQERWTRKGRWTGRGDERNGSLRRRPFGPHGSRGSDHFALGFATELADEAGDLWGLTLKQVSILYSQKAGRRQNFCRLPRRLTWARSPSGYRGDSETSIHHPNFESWLDHFVGRGSCVFAPDPAPSAAWITS